MRKIATRLSFITALALCGAYPFQAADAQNVPSFFKTGNQTLTVTATSARVQFNSAGPTVMVINTGSVTAYLNFGTNTVTATTSDTPLNPGCTVAYSIANGTANRTFIAAITASGTTILAISTGTGIPTLAPSACGGAGISANVNISGLNGTAPSSGNPFPVSIISGGLNFTAPTLGGNASIASVTSTSSRVAFAANTTTYPAVLLTNNSSTDLFYALGTNAVVATTSSASLPAGYQIVLNIGATTNVAAVTASGTATLRATQLTAPALVSGGGSGGGGGPTSAVNITQVGGVAVALGQAAMAASFPVVIANNQTAVPVSAATLPLPTGAATSALQATNSAQGAATAGQTGSLTLGATTTAAPTQTNGTTNALSLTTAGALRVDNSAVTQPISAASLPLPTGAATAAKQPALGVAGTPSNDVLTVQGISSMTPLLATLSGTNNIATVTALTGITNPVTVAQATGTNLHIVCDSGCAGSGGTASNFGAAFPTPGTAIGATDGTTMRPFRAYDADTGAGADYVPGVVVRVPGAGGSTAASATTPLAVISVDKFGTLSDFTVPNDINVKQLNGTTVDTNSGNKSAGTQRFVLATDQPNLATPLNTTGVITSLIPGTGATSLGKAEDAVHSSGDTGVFALAVRNDSLATFTSTDGDYSPIAVTSSGQVQVTGGVAQGSTTSGQTLAFIGGAVNTTAPTYTTAQTNALSLTTTGYLRTTDGLTTGTKAPGAAATNSQLVGCVYNSTPVTLTDGQQASCQADTAGYVKVTGGYAAGSTTSGQALAMIGAAVTTADPSYTTAQTNYLSLTAAGYLRTTSPAIGTAGATAPISSMYIGRNLAGANVPAVACGLKAIYDASTNGSTELVALTGGQTVYVCGYLIKASGTVNVELDYGTGTACATGNTKLTPAWQMIAQSDVRDGTDTWRGLSTPISNALCLKTSAGVAVQAAVYYTKF